MKQQAATWNATSAYHLGVYWQETGDFVRAEAAFQTVLSEIGKHAPTLFNLSVTQIRLGRPKQALTTMDRLAAITGPSIPREDDVDRSAGEKDVDGSDKWSALGCCVAYNRALAWRYDEKPEHARTWSLTLARRVLTPPDRWPAWTKGRRAERETLERLKWSALLLHAGICAANHSKPEELHAGALEDQSKIASALDDELDGVDVTADDKERERQRCKRLHDTLEEPSAAKALEWYVRLNAGDDLRTRYNLACYVARLADEASASDPKRAESLCQRGIEHAQVAVRDHRLAAWAEQDPALKSLQQHSDWDKVLSQARSAATTDTA